MIRHKMSCYARNKLTGACIAIVLLLQFCFGSGVAAETANGQESLGSPIEVVLGKSVFQIPSRYFSSAATDGKSVTSASLAFWYPDLRPTERRAVHVPSYRPPEMNRETRPDSFVVKVVGIEVVEIGSRGYVSPNVRRNNLGNFGTRYASKVSAFELTKYPDKHNYTDMYYGENSSRQIEIECVASVPAQFANRLNPLCRSTFLYLRDEVEVNIWFPSDQISRWKEIEESVLTIMRKYQVSGTAFGGE